MPKPLTYQRFSSDVFMLLCRAETPVSKMPEHPVIKELHSQLRESCVIDERRHGRPSGTLTNPRAWVGYFTIGECEFQVKSIYAFPKFFGIICDTEEGTHDTSEILSFVQGVNESVATQLGFEKLG